MDRSPTSPLPSFPAPALILPLPQVAAAEVGASELKSLLTYPDSWGPTEWGPIPFLPEPDVLVQRMERQWGELRAYRGINSTASGKLLVSGLQAGNVFVGVQPALGLEGDPMRLLFERDLTPHPQVGGWMGGGGGIQVWGAAAGTGAGGRSHAVV